jgi:dynein heavy chain
MSLFEHYYDPDNKNFINWEKLVTEYLPPPDGKFSKILVPTSDTKKFSYLLSKHITERGFKRPVMFVGPSGTAKSTIS